MTARLSLFHGNAPVRELLLDDATTYVIGREPDCEICVADPELSRRHARLASSGDSRWSITDLDSKNGVFLGGSAARQSALHDGTWIGLGSLSIRFDLLDEKQLARLSGEQTHLRLLTQQGRAEVGAAAGDVLAILRKLLATVLKISATQRGFAMLTRGDGDLEVACSLGIADGDPGTALFEGSRGAIREALTRRAGFVTNNAAMHEDLANRQSIIAARTGALVCLPLIVFEKIVGIIYSDTSEPGRFFTELDVELLDELANHAAIAVAASQLGVELDDIDDRIVENPSTHAALATMRYRIPDVNRATPGARTVPMTGLRWSRLETRI